MTTFLDVHPTAENHWRALILFGRNVASYKFALGRSLLKLGGQANDLILLEDLAIPYAMAICEHLKASPKQVTSSSSRFLDQCRAFNAGQIDQDALRDTTVQLGFNNVIDAFHRLGPADLSRRFFLDERGQNKGIRVTGDLRALASDGFTNDLSLENEARWRLVETAWELGVGRDLIIFDPESQNLLVSGSSRRISVTSCRAALNGYQKGHCFYCFRAARIDHGEGVDVDHFIPWTLQRQLTNHLNGIWNLVLSCVRCNRGFRGKFDLIPEAHLLERLHQRNEFLISSHHPLRETLMSQTGQSEPERISFLKDVYRLAVEARIGTWSPFDACAPVF